VLHAVRAGFHLSTAVAEDVLQETFVRAFKHLEHLRDPQRFGLWVQVIGRREALAHVKGRSAREKADVELAREAADVVEQVVAEEPALAVVRALLSELEEGQERRIVHRFYVDGDCSAQQLADELGVARGTVTSRLTRFRARIKRRLAALVAAASEPQPKGSGA
jgi:RNA polymerase sigma-70 factor (ECF subfamily)